MSSLSRFGLLLLCCALAKSWPRWLLRNPVPVTFSNFPCDDFPDGKGQMTITLNDDAALAKLFSDIDAVAVCERADGSGATIAATSLNMLKPGVPYFILLEDSIRNAAAAFEHKAYLAMIDELARLGRN